MLIISRSGIPCDRLLDLIGRLDPFLRHHEIVPDLEALELLFHGPEICLAAKRETVHIFFFFFFGSTSISSPWRPAPSRYRSQALAGKMVGRRTACSRENFLVLRFATLSRNKVRRLRSVIRDGTSGSLSTGGSAIGPQAFSVVFWLSTVTTAQSFDQGPSFRGPRMF